MTIHPTALVAPEARLGAGTTVGPFSILGPAVSTGPGCQIGAHVVLENRVELGTGVRVGHGCILGADPQDLSFDPARDTAVRVGDGVVLREYVTIHRASKEGGATVVGEGCFLMNGAHVGHDCRLGCKVILANNVLLGGHVEVQDRAFLGGGSVFHQFIRIGRLAMVKGGCRFGKDIPPFLMATGENQVAGLNAIGLRRAGFSMEARSEIKQAFRLLYASGFNVSQALEQAAGQTWGVEAEAFFAFVREARKRGICDYAWRDVPGGVADPET